MSRKMGKKKMGGARKKRAAAPKAMVIRSLSDPWHGKGAKWPDANAAASATLTVLTRFTVTPDVNGYYEARVYPGVLRNFVYDAPTSAGGVVTGWGSGTYNSANYTNILANYAGYRVVSAGVRLRYTGNDYSNGGLLSVRSDVATAHTATTPPMSRDDFSAHSLDCRYKDGFTFVAKRTGVEAEHYDPVDKLADDNWSDLTIFISGGDTSSPQSSLLEIVQNLELLPIPGTVLAQSVSPAAQSNDQAKQAVHNAAARGSPFRPSG